MKRLLHITIIINLIFAFGCGEKITDKNQGIIIYKVTYPKMDKNNFMRDFMPDKMVMKFKGNKYSTSLTAGMGMFKSSFIVDKENNQFSQVVKLINKKYALTLKGEEIVESINKLPKYTIKKTGKTKKIMNYICNKAIVTVDNEENDAFEIFYTNRIEIENPNWCTQFSSIDGIMLEYQYEKYDVCMKFEAKSIKFMDISDNEFEIDKEYQFISEDEMNKEMKEIFESFN